MGPGPEGAHGRFNGGVGRHDDDDLVRGLLFDGFQKLDAVHSGKQDVGEDQVKGPFFKQLQGLLGPAGGGHLVAVPFKNPPQGITEGGLVVHDQEPFGHQFFSFRNILFARA